jgi:hypothetical protein
MRRLFRFKYPKITLLIVFSILAYWIFSQGSVQGFVEHMGRLSYLGVFIAGILFSFGFTTPFAIGYFLVANPSNIYLAALIGGCGSVVSDLTIFKIIRFSFMDEFKRLEKTKPMKDIHSLLSSKFLARVRVYLLYAFAGIIIASPLPDEIGVTMLAGLSRIKTSVLVVISLVMNTLGIFVMLLIGG